MISINNTTLNTHIRHSVIILSYNQEYSISNTLDSILNQNILPYEIIIGDDASEDKTYEIIREYQFKFPILIKAYQHPKNIGIFPNLNFLMKQVTGDIVSFIGGDDIILPGLFCELNKVIDNNKVDLNRNYVIVTNSINCDQKGKKVLSDNHKYKNKDPFKRRIRYSIDYRSIGISSSLLRTSGPIIESIGYQADWIWSLKIDCYSEQHFYTPFVSSVYNSGIGIVSKTKRNLLSQSMLKVLPIIRAEFIDNLDRKDFLFLNLVEKFEKYQLMPSLSNYLKFLTYLVLNINNFDSNKSLINIGNIIPIQIRNILHLFKSKFL
jgi:glycosyltransferase involved in cell wall biosynthesis